MMSDYEIAFLFAKRAGQTPCFQLVSAVATPFAKFPPAFHARECSTSGFTVSDHQLFARWSKNCGIVLILTLQAGHPGTQRPPRATLGGSSTLLFRGLNSLPSGYFAATSAGFLSRCSC